MYTYLYEQTHLLSDSTQFLQFGNKEQNEFYRLMPDERGLQYSTWKDFPTKEKPLNKYKFASLHLAVSRDLHVIERWTYSLLDWFGDWGGLLDSLNFIASILVGPFSAHAL